MSVRSLRAEAYENLIDKIEFQKEEIERIKSDISAADRNFECKYIERFMNEYTDYRNISSYEELLARALAARVIYIGDYHALAESQGFAAQFLTDLARYDSGLMLGLEMLYGRDQRALDQWLSGAIGEEEFLRRVRYQREWGYDWSSYRRLFEAARALGIPIWGIDCGPRENFKAISRRDLYAAQRIVSLLKQHRERRLVVLFGEAHLSRSHLPAKVTQMLAREAMRAAHLIILQNLDDVYWKLASRGREQEKVVRIARGIYCVFNATPYLKYESYRRMLERWRKQDGEDDDEACIGSTLDMLIDTLLNFLQLDKYRHKLTQEDGHSRLLVDALPEIYFPDELASFEALLRSERVAPEEALEAFWHLELTGGCYLPGANVMFIGRHSLACAAEQAAHFVHSVCAGWGTKGGKQQAADSFYGKILHEALGYFVSKLLDPSRGDSAARLGGPCKVDELLQIDAILKRVKGLPKIRRPALAARCGYGLGELLYGAYLAGRASREAISALFKQPLDEPQAARQALLGAFRVAGIKHEPVD